MTGIGRTGTVSAPASDRTGRPGRLRGLVVSGFKSQFRGTGSVNGVPGYDFRLTAYDGQVTGGGGVDKFRIKVTRNGQTIFDNRMGVPEDPDVADPQVIAGGSIVIHR